MTPRKLKLCTRSRWPVTSTFRSHFLRRQGLWPYRVGGSVGSECDKGKILLIMKPDRLSFSPYVYWLSCPARYYSSSSSGCGSSSSSSSVYNLILLYKSKDRKQFKTSEWLKFLPWFRTNDALRGQFYVLCRLKWYYIWKGQRVLGVIIKIIRLLPNVAIEWLSSRVQISARKPVVLTRVFCGFSPPSSQISRQYLTLGHDYFHIQPWWWKHCPSETLVSSYSQVHASLQMKRTSPLSAPWEP
jgi:hypothetical protein